VTKWFREGRPKGRPSNSTPGNPLRLEKAAWWHVMGYEAGPPGSLDQVEKQFRRLAARAHPDRGGSAERMQQLIHARALARRQLSP